MTRRTKAAKGGDKKLQLHEAEVFTALAAHYLNEGNSARTFDCSDDDARHRSETADLLTLCKPIIYAANLDEAGYCRLRTNNAYFRAGPRARGQGGRVRCSPSAPSSRQDIAELDDPEERAMFLEDLGIAGVRSGPADPVQL